MEALAFGERLVALLARNGIQRRWAGTYLSKRYKVSTVTANDWLNGKFRPEIATAKQIAVDHGCTFDHLYFGAEDGDQVTVSPPAVDNGYRVAQLDAEAGMGESWSTATHRM